MATWLESVNAKNGNPGEQGLEELHAVLAIVAAKTTPDEDAAFGRRVAERRAGSRRGCEGGRLHGLWHSSGQRWGEGHAGRSAKRP